MRFRFLLADPQGDIELAAQDLEQRFLISPGKPHPRLTLQDYFGALKKFITTDDVAPLKTGLGSLGLAPIRSSDMVEIIIRSEKHGALYHIASITLTAPGITARFAVTTALSDSARDSLAAEFAIMQQLAGVNPEFLPRLFWIDSVAWQTNAGPEAFTMVLGEWLAGYHEWHISLEPASGIRLVRLWDYDAGFRFLTGEESFAMLRQAAFILTCYYDQNTFAQIYPWHHGAGDFIVKTAGEAIDVKLITVRQYEPLVRFDLDEEADRLVAAMHFLLNITLRMRLDRFDGVGEPAWIDAYAVNAAVQGFIAGLAAAETAGRLAIGPIPAFMEIMRAFDAREIHDMYASLLAVYAEEDEDDYRLICEKLPEHAVELYAALQGFSANETTR